MQREYFVKLMKELSKRILCETNTLDTTSYLDEKNYQRIEFHIMKPKSTISMMTNLIFHRLTMNIELCYNFIRDQVILK